MKGEIAVSEVARKLIEEFTAADDIRDAGLTTPPDVERLDDIAYGPDQPWQSMDLYRPRNAESPLPVIVSFHGGGWVYGDKERYQFYCMDLARRGFGVLNFTYRLAPVYKFPAPLEDCNSVFAWLMANGRAHGLDTDHVFAVGDSAGAHGLGLYACLLTNPAYAAGFPFKAPEGLRLRAVALNCGVYRVEPDPNGGLMSLYLPRGGAPDEIETVSVMDHVTGDFPPTFLMTAPQDFLKSAAAPMAALLAEKNVEHDLHFYADREKTLAHVFHLNIRHPDARRCNDDECAFFRAHMEG